MSIIFTILMLLVFVAIAVSLYREGLWTNSIHLINLVTACLVATGFYETLAGFLEGMFGFFKSYTYVMDYLSLWILFILTYFVLRTITDKVSRVQIRFAEKVNMIGGLIAACLVGWIFLAFTLFTLHTAPLSPNFMFGGFTADEPMIFGLAPDKSWIVFARSTSRHAYARSTPVPFDPFGEYHKRYKDRRKELTDNLGETDSLKKGS
jgi:uncharacterized membrane protein required for colicin V production